MTSTNPVHTAGNAVPPLGGELEGLFEDLAAVHDVGVDQILSGLRHIALNRHTVDRTQTLIAVLAGGADSLNIVALIGQIIARLADADTNPALHTLPLDQQKQARREGQNTAHWHTDPDLAQTASETSAAITGN
ncbi:hypothetical protein [Streptomyces sp. LUP47B]|uniref:hypothetical protein n=1 Tax=Streptomyces sp. LUP47B TaxID=1890286 RepID=UPI0008518D4F|nr:hypothetical protein [Streptomyces sp. LUP47B]